MQANVLVSSAGTASAVNVIKALRRQHEYDVRIIATDIDELAPGLHLADRRRLTPSIFDPDFVDSITRIIGEEAIQVYFPIFSKELEVIAAHRNAVESAGARLMIPSYEAVRLSNDKGRMASLMAANGIKTPRTFQVESPHDIDGLPYPVFYKPRKSSSSKGAGLARSATELRQASERDRDLVLQEYVEGQEYTVDLLFGAGGDPWVVAPRKRLATRAGQSIKGVTVPADPFIEPVRTVATAVGLEGPCNMQFIESSGALYFIELNPRFAAGGLMLTVAAGANIPLLVLKHLLDGETPVRAQTRPGVYMTRYWEEVIVEP